MAQKLVSFFISDGRFRVQAINAIGRRTGRIIEVEVLDTGERFHGSAKKMERLVKKLRTSDGDVNAAREWISENRS